MFWAVTQIAWLLLRSCRGSILFFILLIVSWRYIILATVLDVFVLVIILAAVRS